MQKLGRYYLNEHIGSGGFSKVYKAVDPRLDSTVAIKVLADDWLVNPDIRERFTNEAILLRKLQSEHGVPGLVQVYDIDEAETGQPFIVMSYANGGTLSEKANENPYQLSDIEELINFLADVLGPIHSRHVVHRDVKPSNIFISSVGSEKKLKSSGLKSKSESFVLGDFGLAKYLQDDRTALSLVAGTQKYAAPELYGGEEIDHRADIYSASVIIKDLLASLAENISEQLSLVLERGLSHDYKKRQSSIDEWRKELIAAMPKAHIKVPPLPPTAIGKESIPNSPPPVAAVQQTVLAKNVATSADPRFTNHAMMADYHGSKPKGNKVLIGVGVFIFLLVIASVTTLILLTESNSENVSDSLLYEGPATIKVGDSAVYKAIADDDDLILWTDWDGEVYSQQDLMVTPTKAGTLEFALQVGKDKNLIEVEVVE